MPFDTPAGPAVLAVNIVSGREGAKRLGVHWATFYQWGREQPDFPKQCSDGRFDYEELYDWFQKWVANHSRDYPRAHSALQEQDSA